MWINEHDFVAEFLSLETGKAAAEGELAELVLTNLGRVGSPMIRYRTGDLVRPCWTHAGPNRFVFLDGGVIGRADDMLVVRGVNVFPSSLDQILRSFPEVVEYRVTARKTGEMDQLTIEIEDHLNAAGSRGRRAAAAAGAEAGSPQRALGHVAARRGQGKTVRGRAVKTNRVKRASVCHWLCQCLSGVT